MTEKMTKKDYFNAVLDLIDTMSATDPTETFGERKVTAPDMHTFIENEIELLTRKNASRSTKPTKSAIETADIAEKILAILPASGKFTATEIANMSDSLKGTSNQRMTAALKVLVSTKLVENIREKGKSYFQRI